MYKSIISTITHAAFVDGIAPYFTALIDDGMQIELL